MRILFEQGAPVLLRRHLTRHVVNTAFERGGQPCTMGSYLMWRNKRATTS
jgi:hypothetical protein